MRWHGHLVKDKSEKRGPSSERCCYFNIEQEQTNDKDQESSSEDPNYIEENLSEKKTPEPRKKAKASRSTEITFEENLSQKKTPEPKKEAKSSRSIETANNLFEEKLSQKKTPEPKKKAKASRSTIDVFPKPVFFRLKRQECWTSDKRELSQWLSTMPRS